MQMKKETQQRFIRELWFSSSLYFLSSSSQCRDINYQKMLKLVFDIFIQKGIIMPGHANPAKPPLIFEGPVPPSEAFLYDSVIYMPSKDMRPLIVTRASTFR